MRSRPGWLQVEVVGVKARQIAGGLGLHVYTKTFQGLGGFGEAEGGLGIGSVDFGDEGAKLLDTSAGFAQLGA